LEKELFIIAGPNGSGKTTFANDLLTFYKYDFLNADEIAEKLSPTDIEKVRITAGKIFLKKLKSLIKRNKSIVVESTLSGNYLLPIIKQVKTKCYNVFIIFIFLENEEIAIKRIEERVLKGGHWVPTEDVIRRFKRSKNNFWNTYKNIANGWFLFYNSENTFQQVAFGKETDYVIINDDNFKVFIDDIKD
jgi:predicted ABC-type ATPase